MKHEEILLEFESLKARRDRMMPPSSMTMISNHQSSPMTSPRPWPTPVMVDSQTSPTEDVSFPLLSSATSTATTATVATSTVAHPPVASSSSSLSNNVSPTAIQSPRTAISKAINTKDTPEVKQTPMFNNQTTQIVIAKYSYEPLQYSPNDHPEVELPLNVGEYYLIYGEVDEVRLLERKIDFCRTIQFINSVRFSFVRMDSTMVET